MSLSRDQSRGADVLGGGGLGWDTGSKDNSGVLRELPEGASAHPLPQSLAVVGLGTVAAGDLTHPSATYSPPANGAAHVNVRRVGAGSPRRYLIKHSGSSNNYSNLFSNPCISCLPNYFSKGMYS